MHFRITFGAMWFKKNNARQPLDGGGRGWGVGWGEVPPW